MLPRLGATSRVHGRNLHLRLSDRLYWRVSEVAEQTGLALNGAVRLLLERALAEGADTAQVGINAELAKELQAMSQSTLASLIAAEEAILTISAILPHRHLEELENVKEEATNNARQRLLYVEKAIAEEAGC